MSAASVFALSRLLPSGNAVQQPRQRFCRVTWLLPARAWHQDLAAAKQTCCRAEEVVPDVVWWPLYPLQDEAEVCIARTWGSFSGMTLGFAGRQCIAGVLKEMLKHLPSHCASCTMLLASRRRACISTGQSLRRPSGSPAVHQRASRSGMLAWAAYASSPRLAVWASGIGTAVCWKVV